MVPSTKFAQMVLLCQKKGVGRALDKKYFRMEFPKPLVQNQNNFTEIIIRLPSTTKLIRGFSLAEQHGYQS